MSHFEKWSFFELESFRKRIISKNESLRKMIHFEIDHFGKDSLRNMSNFEKWVSSKKINSKKWSLPKKSLRKKDTGLKWINYNFIRNLTFSWFRKSHGFAYTTNVLILSIIIWATLSGQISEGKALSVFDSISAGELKCTRPDTLTISLHIIFFVSLYH